MAIQKVLRMGDPKLLRVCQPVTKFNTKALDQLIENMWDTMQAEKGAGLAAPQIGINLRVVVFGLDSNPRYPDAPDVPLTVMINPEITLLTDETEDSWEGCLSIPGLRAQVPRYTHIRYQAFDQKGQLNTQQAKGFHARVVQHECDHLDGILYPQRITNIQSFGFREELENNGLLAAQPCDD